MKLYIMTDMSRISAVLWGGLGLPPWFNFPELVGGDLRRTMTREVNRAVRERRVTASSGPYLEFALNDGQVGDTIVLAEQASLTARLRVQTPSWFGVDRVEIYRNGLLEKRFRLTGEPARIVDFDERIELPRPSEDSWYVAIAYGVNDGNELSPVYNGLIYGHLLIPTVISIGLGQILGGFDSLFARLEEKGFRELLDDALAGLAGGTEMPDSFPTMPFGFTNPIWVDVDGRGFTAPDAQDRDGDGQPDLPPFCSQACAVALDDVTGLPGPRPAGRTRSASPMHRAAPRGSARSPSPRAARATPSASAASACPWPPRRPRTPHGAISRPILPGRPPARPSGCCAGSSSGSSIDPSAGGRSRRPRRPVCGTKIPSVLFEELNPRRQEVLRRCASSPPAPWSKILLNMPKLLRFSVRRG